MNTPSKQKKVKGKKTKKVLTLSDLDVKIENVKEMMPSVRPREDVGPRSL